jgi:hypothetical protein
VEKTTRCRTVRNCADARRRCWTTTRPTFDPGFAGRALGMVPSACETPSAALALLEAGGHF